MTDRRSGNVAIVTCEGGGIGRGVVVAVSRRPGGPGPGCARGGITIVGREADLVVLDPAATGGVQVALTGALLPGDPHL